MKNILMLQTLTANEDITMHAASSTSVNCKGSSSASLFAC
jgi:hypothetical protein